MFQLGESLVGIHPLSVQSLLAVQIIKFLEALENSKAVPPSISQNKLELRYHILDSSIIEKLLLNQ